MRIRRDDFEDGILPEVCVHTGGLADRNYAFHATWSPSWPLALVLLGPVGWVLAFVLIRSQRREAHGYLPYSDAGHAVLVARRHRAIEAALVSAVVATGGAAWALADLAIPAVGFTLLILGVIGVAAGGSFASTVPGSVTIRPDDSGRWVTVKPVHPAFADAYGKQGERRRAQRRATVRADWSAAMPTVGS